RGRRRLRSTAARRAGLRPLDAREPGDPSREPSRAARRQAALARARLRRARWRAAGRRSPGALARGQERPLPLVVRGFPGPAARRARDAEGDARAPAPASVTRAIHAPRRGRPVTRPIRVLHLLVTTSPGGGPKHVHDLVRHLPGEFEVLIAAPRDGVFFDRFRDLGVTTVELPLSRLRVWPVQLAIRPIQRPAVALAHPHGKGPGLYGRIAAAAVAVPAVHTLHGIHYGGYSRPGRGLYLGLERQLSRMSRVIINVSASQEAEGLGLGLFAPPQS